MQRSKTWEWAARRLNNTFPAIFSGMQTCIWCLWIHHWAISYPKCSHATAAISRHDAAMKVNAVMGRGTKKGFIDVYFLLQHYSSEELIQFYLQKYTDGSEYRALLSMTYSCLLQHCGNILWKNWEAKEKKLFFV